MKNNEPKRGRPAADGETATDKIHLRVKPSQRAAYVRVAWPGKLTPWILATLDKAAEEKQASMDALVF